MATTRANSARWTRVDSSVSTGDGIYVLAYDQVDGQRTYTFYEFQRGTPMLLLLLLFCVAVLTLGRWRGSGRSPGSASAWS